MLDTILNRLDTFWQTATLGDWFVVLVVFIAIAAIPTLILLDQILPLEAPGASLATASRDADAGSAEIVPALLASYSRDHARIVSFHDGQRRRALLAATTIGSGKAAS